MLGLATIAFGDALVAVTRYHNPGLALKFGGQDPIALVGASLELIKTLPTKPDAVQIIDLARQSLVQQGVNPYALPLLKIASPSKESDSALSLSMRLSRRDLRAHILLIEHYAQEGNTGKTLNQYDLALVTNNEARNTLFPVLADAIEDPEVNTEFSKYLATDRPWVTDFIRYKLETDLTSDALSDVFIAASAAPKSPDFGSLRQYVFERAVRVGSYDKARRIFVKYRIADPALLTSAPFWPSSHQGQDTALRWQLLEQTNIGAQLVTADSGRGFDLHVNVNSNSRGTAATKLLLLAPGHYAIVIRYGAVASGASPIASWLLRCIGSTQEAIVWNSGIVAADVEQTTFDQLIVPENCGGQMLELQVSAGEGQTEKYMTVRSVQLQRVR